MSKALQAWSQLSSEFNLQVADGRQKLKLELSTETRLRCLFDRSISHRVSRIDTEHACSQAAENCFGLGKVR